MTPYCEEILKLYIGRTVDLDHVRDWLATNQWSLDTQGQALADEVDAALVQLDDGHITQADLRSWVIQLGKT